MQQVNETLNYRHTKLTQALTVACHIQNKIKCTRIPKTQIVPEMTYKVSSGTISL